MNENQKNIEAAKSWFVLAEILAILAGFFLFTTKFNTDENIFFTLTGFVLMTDAIFFFMLGRYKICNQNAPDVLLSLIIATMSLIITYVFWSIY